MTNNDNNNDFIARNNTVFISKPSIIHFNGFNIKNNDNDESDKNQYSQTIEIINSTNKSQRFQIVSPSNKQFIISYDKQATLAPGMSQSIKILYEPISYNYLCDYLRIKSEEDVLIIPIHAYPSLNNINFPKNLLFGDSPLLQVKQKVITLNCSIPLEFHYSIEITKPHPYITIDPIDGVIPANSNIDITVTFNPLTLGTFTTTIRLIIGQLNFKPKECIIVARSVSGIVKSNEINEAEIRLFDYLNSKNELLNKTLMQTQSRLTETKATENSLDLLNNNKWFKGNQNIISRGTIRKEDLNNKAIKFSVIDNRTMVIEPKDPRPKVPEGFKPYGIGSGAVFDSGSEWISNKTKQLTMNSKSNHVNPSDINSKEVIINGYKIPDSIVGVTNTNYILTQEIGKLKPKDLKIAIMNHKIQQQKQNELLRQQNQSNELGILTLNKIINDESKLNDIKQDDYSNKQLNELIFLTSRNNYDKYNKDKAIHISEVYLGLDVLTDIELKAIESNRLTINKTNLKFIWMNRLIKSNTVCNNDMSVSIKSIDEITQLVKPIYSINSNDVWSKRINTLNKFISLISKFITQQRINKRLNKLKNVIKSNNIKSKQDMENFVIFDNLNNQLVTSEKSVTTNDDSNASTAINTMSNRLCNQINHKSIKYDHESYINNNLILNVHDNILQSISLPNYIYDDDDDDVTDNQTNDFTNDPADDYLMSFDDRVLLSTNQINEFENFNFSSISLSNQFITFPTIDYIVDSNEPLYRIGALEELAINQSMDDDINIDMSLLDLSD